MQKRLICMKKCALYKNESYLAYSKQKNYKTQLGISQTNLFLTTFWKLFFRKKSFAFLFKLLSSFILLALKYPFTAFYWRYCKGLIGEGCGLTVLNAIKQSKQEKMFHSTSFKRFLSWSILQFSRITSQLQAFLTTVVFQLILGDA